MLQVGATGKREIMLYVILYGCVPRSPSLTVEYLFRAFYSRNNNVIKDVTLNNLFLNKTYEKYNYTNNALEIDLGGSMSEC
jgi:hypothetical protein